MIRIKKVTLFHFCQFTCKEMYIDEGLTRIRAANGAGKTNFFRGIVYGLTSWCDPAVGTQTSLQKDDELVPGYSELLIEVDGTEYTLRRYTVTSAKQADILKCGDEVIAEKRQRVNAWLESHLPVTLPVLAQIMWVRQEKSSWLLTTTAANINTFLGLIFDTKKLEKLRDHLKTAADKVATLRADFDVVQKQCEEEINQLPNIEELNKELTDGTEKLAALKASLEVDGISRQTKDDLEKQYTAFITDSEKRLAELETLLKNKPSTDLLIYIEKHTSKLNSWLTRLETQLGELSRSYGSDKDVFEVLRASHDTERCQYCNSVLVDGEQYRNNLANKLMPGDGWTADSAIAFLEKSLRENKAKFRQLSTHKITTHQLLENLRSKSSTYFSSLDSFNNLEKEKLTLEQRLPYVQQQLTELRQKRVVDVDKNALQVEIANLSDCLKTVQQCLSDAQAKKAYCEKTILQCENDRKSYTRNTYVKNLLVKLRDVLSQSRAQARFISSKVDLLNAHIASYMELSEMPFTLRLHPQEHIFVYTMKDSSIEHPAAMLSGAQQATASISIQMALAAVAVPELTMLLIDEADAALSPENKIIAARLYRTLTDSVAGTVLVVSHAEAVSEDCDRVVDL